MLNSVQHLGSSLLGEILKQVQDDTSKRNLKHLWIGFRWIIDFLKGKAPMNRLKRLLRSRDFILILGLVLGLAWGHGARWTSPLTLPALAVAMTLSVMGIPGAIFRSPRSLLGPALSGIVMSYPVLGGVILGASFFLIGERSLWDGFVLVAAVPPGVAVIPFAYLLKGNGFFSLVATMGAYLGALVITPLMALWLLGTASVDPAKLFVIMVELILLPLVVSQVLVRTGASKRIEPLKGTVTNWSFFLVIYTIVGLNRQVFLDNPLSLLPVAAVAVASTFLLGWAIREAGKALRVEPGTVTSLVLLGTIKNYGLAGGLSLALFSKDTAVPATVSTIFMTVYIIWLGFQMKNQKDY
jgi:BASS family bile acid:Na+ symporter